MAALLQRHSYRALRGTLGMELCAQSLKDL